MYKAVEHLHLISQKKRVEIAIGEGLFQSDLPTLCRSFKGRIALIADAAIASTFGKKLQESTGAELLPFSGGEEAKTRENKQKFEDFLFQRKFGRDTLLIGLGGGVVTDFTAFLASTYMRGIPLILVPTTLLGMVDAAIGGKSAVDTPFGKNLVGAIYHPIHICIDPTLLASLPEPQWIFGLAEILKYGLISDPKIWEFLEQNPKSWKESLQPLILSSVRAKKTVVEQDPDETLGLRRILNFGHTVGHAIEVLSHFKISHGEAVAIGCIVESCLSHQLGYLDHSTLNRIKTLFWKFPFSFKIPYSTGLLIEAMEIDKKAKGSTPRFVLIDKIGHALPFDGEYCKPVPPAEIEKALSCLNT